MAGYGMTASMAMMDEQPTDSFPIPGLLEEVTKEFEWWQWMLIGVGVALLLSSVIVIFACCCCRCCLREDESGAPPPLAVIDLENSREAPLREASNHQAAVASPVQYRQETIQGLTNYAPSQGSHGAIVYQTNPVQPPTMYIR